MMVIKNITRIFVKTLLNLSVCLYFPGITLGFLSIRAYASVPQAFLR